MMTGSLKMIARSSISPTSGSEEDVRTVEVEVEVMDDWRGQFFGGNKAHATGREMRCVAWFI